ncbi:PLP-dependent aminotransferase family protein [Kocuria indica]|nr:PLP-dependent aminotransferase family protein [Kocuria indica]
MTTGSQNGLGTLARVMIDPGVRHPRGSAFLLGRHGRVRGRPGGGRPRGDRPRGLTPDELEETIEELESQGRRIKFLYTIPSFQNAGGTMMPQQRRDRICEVCAAHHVLIAEDNPYGLLGFEGQTARAVRADDENVVYLGSASKMFTPGLRVGWTVAPDSLATILGLQSEAVALNPSVFAQEVVAGCLEKYDWRSVRDEYRVLYGKWAQALMDAFDEHMPGGVTWTRPEGGFYSWITLPQDVDSYDLCMKGIDKGAEIFTTTLKKAMNA